MSTNVPTATYVPMGGPSVGRPMGNAQPGLDSSEVAECRRLLGSAPLARAIEEIEESGCATAEELGALRDLELWGEDPFDG